jgi:dolichol-phosphate mannosyltransferase
MDPRDAVVVMPTYNEAGNLDAIAQAVTAHGYRLLVVDDNSPDGTGDLADKIASANTQVAVLHRPSKEGLGQAYVAGFMEAASMGARITCQMDADFSHDPADLPRLVSAINTGATLSIGSRYVEGGSVTGWSWRRRVLSMCGNLYTRKMLGVKVRDSTAGFRAFHTQALATLEPGTCKSSGYSFQIEMTYRAVLAGYEIVEIPVVFRERIEGDSKMNMFIAIEAVGLITQWGVRRMIRGLVAKPTET